MGGFFRSENYFKNHFFALEAESGKVIGSKIFGKIIMNLMTKRLLLPQFLLELKTKR